MKLILKDLIKIKKEYLEEGYRDLLEKFSIYYKEDDNHIFIEEQKITLDEININTLFSEIFMDECELEYRFLGGRGCEFSLYLHSKNKY